MNRIAIVLLLLVSAAHADEINPSQPLTVEQYQTVILDMCVPAVFANRMRYGDFCARLKENFAATKSEESKPPALTK